MGTFRSVGATKLKTTVILFLESIFYGIIGGAFGVGVGIIGLNIVLDMLNGFKEYGIETKVNYNAEYMVIAFVFAIFISVISAGFTILKTNSHSTKDIILNTVQTKNNISIKGFILGIIVLASSLIFDRFNGYDMVNSIIIFGGIICGVVLITPYCVRGIATLLDKIYRGKKGEIKLAIRNLKNSKILINNIVLSTVGIGLVIAIMTITTSIESIVGITMNSMQYEYSAKRVDNSNEVLDIVKDIDGVKETYKDYVEVLELNVNGEKKAKIDVWAMENSEKFLDFYSDQIRDSEEIKEDFNIKEPYQILIKGDKSKVGKKLNEEFLDRGELIVDVQKRLQEEKENTLDSIMYTSNIFVVIALIMAIFGMGNNLVISFIQRKRELAVLYSVSMSKGQLINMIKWESILAFGTSALMGSVLGGLLISILPKLLGAMGLVIGVSYSIANILMVVGVVFVTLSLTAIVPVIKLKKMKVVEELKYE